LKPINYNQDKSDLLKQARGVSLKEVAVMIAKGDYIDVIDNPNYPSQQVFILNIDAYIWECPFIISETEIFLKTLFPNRKLTKKYLGE